MNCGKWAGCLLHALLAQRISTGVTPFLWRFSVTLFIFLMLMNDMLIWWNDAQFSNVPCLKASLSQTFTTRQREEKTCSGVNPPHLSGNQAGWWRCCDLACQMAVVWFFNSEIVCACMLDTKLVSFLPLWIPRKRTSIFWGQQRHVGKILGYSSFSDRNTEVKTFWYDVTPSRRVSML